jgi:hypothetical protein
VAQKKKNTHPGLGDGTPRPGQQLPRFDSGSIERVKMSQRETIAEKDEPVPSSEPSKSKRTTTRSFEVEGTTETTETPDKRKWDSEAPTGTRRKKQSRPPVQVDDVGRTAVRIAGARREGAPKLLASRAMLARAPIDSRAAFLLSMIDGNNTVESLVDATGMSAQEVRTTLERCARLGLVELP